MPSEIKLVEHYDIFSDSSAGEGAVCIGAAIVIDRALNRRIKLVGIFLPAESAEGESLGGILGFSAALHRSRLSKSKISVCWYGDNKSVLDTASSSQPRKSSASNLLGMLVGKTESQFQHVRAHSGHRENDACDKVCKWVRGRFERLLKEHGEGGLGTNSHHQPENAWLLLDLRSFHQLLRSGDDDAASAELQLKLANLML